MMSGRYVKIKRFIQNDIEPKLPYSTLSNWRAEAKKYKINKKGLLTRDGKPVLRKSDLQKIGLGRVMLENSGNIGKNYRRHDEIGTPLCITVDFETLEDQTVTVRDRDTMKQQRLGPEELIKYYKKYFE